MTITTAHLTLIEKMFLAASFGAVIVLAFPHLTLAYSANSAPLVFEINIPSSLNVSIGNLPLASDDVTAEKVIKLQEYLKKKNPLLVNQADVLARQYHYRLILGISFAESNFCKHQIRANNCWGIGGTKPEQYATLADGITRANDLIQKYHDRGLVNPALMRNRWVGWQNDSWIRAVNQITTELENQGI
ncbi:MAG: hypothetical protein U1C57_02120 [Candidatus Doudnabacteria bacterium]|nr:hypothetical protein [bacterium]MDZ4243877.1 hypothetical protein [Candidatus Doudnabacteria bacterium]